MPSRKKAAGKARRAAKAKKKEDAQEEGHEQDALESQMQRLSINNLLSATAPSNDVVMASKENVMN